VAPTFIMQTKPKPKECANPECNNMFTPRFKTTEKYCCYKCATDCIVKHKGNPTIVDLKRTEIKRDPNYKIPRRSKKGQKQDRIYTARRIVFLKENPVCFIDGCKRKATTVEHTQGRVGKNYLDESTWKPCCLEHNLELETNPELSKKYQRSKIHGGKKE